MIDSRGVATYHRAPMSTGLPDVIDAARAVGARRQYQGAIALSALPRLAGGLAHDRGSVQYTLEFGRDSLGVAFVAMQVEGALPLMCQRTLEPFDFPVSFSTRLGIIAREEDESGLAAGYEPLLCTDGEIKPLDVIEDELILALPVVPTRPGNEQEGETVWSTGPEEAQEEAEAKVNPFAQLSQLKTRR